MSRRRRSRGGHKAALTWIAGIALLCVTVVFFGGLAYFKFTAPAKAERSEATLCPVDGPSATTVILLDATDALPEPSKIQLRTMLGDMADNLRDDELLELRVLRPGEPGGSVLFSKCNPGNGSGLSEWVANPVMARKRWAREFKGPLNDALARMAPSEAKTSPIMQAIQRIALERFSGQQAKKIDKKLVIVSDMIEHDQDYSQYTGSIDYSRFVGTAAYKKLRTDLQGADVSIAYVQRLRPTIDSGRHIEFWAKWISESNGVLTGAEKLQGAS